jgi:DNA-directed RNA polymerase specialized sigma subunit
MNAVDLLNEKEKRVLSMLIKGLSMSEVADIYECTTYEINRVRLQIIDKFDKASPVKIPEERSFQLYCR